MSRKDVRGIWLLRALEYLPGVNLVTVEVVSVGREVCIVVVEPVVGLEEVGNGGGCGD